MEQNKGHDNFGEPETVELEIRELEVRLAEKRRELEGTQEVPEAHELVRETLREHVERATSAMAVASPSAAAHILPEEIKKIEQLPEERRVQALVDVAFSKGIYAAIRLARSFNDAYLLDALHDALTGRLYEELVKRGALKPF